LTFVDKDGDLVLKKKRGKIREGIGIGKEKKKCRRRSAFDFCGQRR